MLRRYRKIKEDSRFPERRKIEDGTWGNAPKNSVKDTWGNAPKNSVKDTWGNAPKNSLKGTLLIA